ncbi:hypothetical protein B0H66DRAFT_111059 [Apodospora peruviana]|uniref:C2H2-type domain-containing protein n=1 Tax=Apodospora peruviana TaxID=516989 RepID=A0AAE0IHB6_9PEZI|nr:hypothetical protein B0H66DRAFT_111059 [Apodospora peruviana]
MEPSSKRRRLAPKVPDPPAQHAISPGPPPPQPQAQPTAQSFQQEPHHAQHYAPPEAVAALPERHDFEAFARHLQDAAMHIYQQTLKPHHTSVSVLLLRWEEDMSVEPDLLALENVFQERYKYHTDRWAIPTVPNPSIKLGVQMAAFLENARPDHLLIIYYAGHGFVGPDNQLYWASNTREDAAKLKWDGVRCLFEDAQSEILLLLDTCGVRDAPMAGSHGAKQAIAAYTPEQSSRDAGSRSFTASLAEALHRLSGGRPFSAQRLHEELLAVKQQDTAQALARLANGVVKAPPAPEKQPVFFTLTHAKGQGIIMVPLDPKGAQLQSPPQSAEADTQNWKAGGEDRPLSPEEVVDLTFDEARVLVCTTFVGDASPDMTFFNQWLHNTPPVASKITVQGMFLGPPTMLLISMPVNIWNIVQHDKVCCFLGYVNSHNMIHLYQRLVTSASNGTAGFKEPEESRLLPAAPVASPPTTRREQTNHVPETTRRQERPRSQVVNSTPSASFAQATPGQTAAAPAPAPVPNSSPATAAAAAAAVAAVATKQNHDVEDYAEVKEAAEQLKALSHVRHVSDADTPSTLDRSSTRLGDSIAVRHAGDPGSSPEGNESGVEDNTGGIGSEFNTPSAKPKARRPLQKQTPKQETHCNHCSHAPFKDSSSLRKHIAAAHTRPFPCAFSFAGCTSTFGSKNEWKRHIASQHLCLTYYRCSACPQSSADGKGNEFNRKDLFTQHLRRMHAPFAIKKSLTKGESKLQSEWEAHVKEMQSSCLIVRRKPPQRSACPKSDCQSVFEGPGSWDEWTEHVGRHMEKGEAGKMGVDKWLCDWALDEGIIEDDGEGKGGFRLVTPATNGVNGFGGAEDGVGDGSSLMVVKEDGHGKTSGKTNGHSVKNGLKAVKGGNGKPGMSELATVNRMDGHGRKVEEMEDDDESPSIVVATTAPLMDLDDEMDVDAGL